MKSLTAVAQTVNELVQAGKYTDAKKVLNKQIRKRPKLGELRRLAGTVATAMGEYDTAEKRLREASTRGADPAFLLGDKAGLSLATGDVDGALELARAAVDERPDSTSLQVVLARVAHAAGHAAVEEAAYKRALELSAHSATAALGLARIYRRQQDAAAANEALAAVLRANPLAPGVFVQRLEWAVEDGVPHEATALANELLIAHPAQPSVWMYRGYALNREGKVDDAVSDFQHALALNPAWPRARVVLGTALIHERRIHEAVGVFMEGVDEAKPDPDMLYGLAQAYEALGKQQRAHELYQKMAQINALDPRAQLGLARHIGAGGDFESALRQYDGLLSDPKLRTNALVGKAELYGKMGDTQNAAALVDSILADEPQHIPALATRIHLAGRGQAVPDDVVANAEQIARESGTKLPTLLFALGSLKHRQKKRAEAFDWWEQANKATGLRYDSDSTAAYFERVRQQFTAVAPTASGPDTAASKAAIFLVGMPRSGTSLTEQALAMHPEVAAGGELSILPSIVRLIPNILNNGKQYPEYVSDLAPDNLAELGAEYLDNVAEIKGEGRYVTDKLPHNFMHAGFISKILPNATLLHCRRNPMDNCLSLFQTYFSGQHTYAYALETIGEYYREYDRLMKHYASIGVNIIDVPYERTVSDLEGTMRGLCAHLELDWAPEILDFHTSSRVVMTASNAQVTKPLYATAIGRWKAYESQLAPLRAQIADICEAYAADVPEAASAV